MLDNDCSSALLKLTPSPVSRASPLPSGILYVLEMDLHWLSGIYYFWCLRDESELQLLSVFRSERARWITALGHSSGKQPPDRTSKFPGKVAALEHGGALPPAGWHDYY